MKSNIRSFVLAAVAGASQRPMLTTEPTRNQLMFRLKTSHLFLLLGLVAPVSGFASDHYCIAVNGGFGEGGTTFIGSGFAVPGEGKCTPWSGFTKAESTVILTSTGTGCLSSDGKALSISVFDADPSFFAQPQAEFIQLTRGDSKEPFKGQDTGYFGGSAEPVSCTSSLLNLPSSHD
jgi:hypothetical protein